MGDATGGWIGGSGEAIRKPSTESPSPCSLAELVGTAAALATGARKTRAGEPRSTRLLLRFGVTLTVALTGSMDLVLITRADVVATTSGGSRVTELEPPTAVGSRGVVTSRAAMPET